MDRYPESDIEFLMQLATEKLHSSIIEARIPDQNPSRYTDKHYNFIGQRGDMLGGYFVQTESTFDLDYANLEDAKDGKVITPVIYKQSFGVKNGDAEVEILTVNVNLEETDEEIPGIAKVQFNAEWAKMIDFDAMAIGDQEGYEELFSILWDARNHNLVGDDLINDDERINSLLEQAGTLARERVGQEATYYHAIFLRAGFCAVESTYHMDCVTRTVTASDFGSETEAEASYFELPTLSEDTGDLPRVQAICPPDKDKTEALSDLCNAVVAIRATFSKLD